MNEKLDGLRVAILVANDFEQVEMVVPRKVLDDAGAQTFLIAPSEPLMVDNLEVVHPARCEVQGIHHDKPGDMFPVSLPLEMANANDFDALLLPGGVMNADQLRIIDKAKEFVQSFDQNMKPIAVICHGPWTLVSAGLMVGRTITSWPSLKDDIRNAGGNWVNQEVCEDRNWVSSRAPQDLPAFNKAMLRLFSQFTGHMRKAA